MLKFEHTEVVGWEAAIRGMRNPLESWAMSDSGWNEGFDVDSMSNKKGYMTVGEACTDYETSVYNIGPNDRDLMMRLRNAGTDHRKFMRMLVVYVDITAPLYFWKEFDTYKVGTVANSCSTMHCIHKKEFTLEDFSTEHLFGDEDMLKESERTDISKDHALAAVNVDGNWCYFSPKGYIQMTCNMLNRFRQLYLETKDKKYWWQMIQLLPTSYNQKRTVMLNYETLANIYKSRKNHKLDEWSVQFMEWIEKLPYSELFTAPVDHSEHENKE